jgi:hypothetical protein
MIAIVSILLVIAVAVNAECENACSGHGECGLNDVCTCYQNWGIGMGGLSGDCSERVCPYDIAFSDAPDMNDEFHKYAECSGRGLCDRNTGECACFDGYTGQGCQRTTCPNDCSGHGTCEFIEDLTFGVHSSVPEFTVRNSMTDVAYNFAYYGWDKGKMRACKCDAPYGDYDCSKRLCPLTWDVMDHVPTYYSSGNVHRLSFVFQTSNCDNADKTFALSVKSNSNEVFTTIPIAYSCTNGHDFALAIANSIKRLPQIDFDVKVTVAYTSYTTTDVNVTFVGCNTQGDQPLLVAHTQFCGDGCTPKLTGLDLAYVNNIATSNVTVVNNNYNYNYECGRHGKCDYVSGECQCFNGFSGKGCSMQTSIQ